MRKYISWKDAPSIAPDRVKVYRNLTYKCWTICDAKDGKLYCHADSVDLRDCKFLVQPAGRARVLKEKQKNVHAYGWQVPRCEFEQAQWHAPAVTSSRRLSTILIGLRHL